MIVGRRTLKTMWSPATVRTKRCVDKPHNGVMGKMVAVAPPTSASAAARKSLFRMDFCRNVLRWSSADGGQRSPSRHNFQLRHRRAAVTPAPDTESRDRLRNPTLTSVGAGLQWLHDKAFRGEFLIWTSALIDLQVLRGLHLANQRRNLFLAGGTNVLPVVLIENIHGNDPVAVVIEPVQAAHFKEMLFV